jgi:cyclopropane-fatty-acyl-phospholipid synthase
MWFLCAVLRRVIHRGRLRLTAPDGGIHDFGEGSPAIAIRITDWTVVRQLAFNPDLALGEAYMGGGLVIETGDVGGLLDLCRSNLGSGNGHWVQYLHNAGRRLIRRLEQHNPVPVARANAAHHYDLSDELYGLFLDADRQYSCGYYLSPDDTLDAAQERKKRHLAAKLLLHPGQRVLDIGSGWGGLALFLAQEAGVDVTGITLSAEQHRYATARAVQLGLDGRVRFLLKDYRDEDQRYDRIVSVGMFEHVGINQYRRYFMTLKRLLTDDGIGLVHTIGSTVGHRAAHPWIEKYIFPGGYTPALSEIVPSIERAGLCITDVEVLRLHYAYTLKAWRQRFMANRERAAALYNERFCRMWEFYLAGCEAGFRHSGLVVFQIQISKRIDAVPLTRGYIEEYERQHRL